MLGVNVAHWAQSIPTISITRLRHLQVSRAATSRLYLVRHHYINCCRCEYLLTRATSMPFISSGSYYHCTREISSHRHSRHPTVYLRLAIFGYGGHLLCKRSMYISFIRNGRRSHPLRQNFSQPIHRVHSREEGFHRNF